MKTKLEPGETWEDVIKEETQKAMRYRGHTGCHPIPVQIASTLVRIAYEGRGIGGHFVNAVLDNDLMEAFARADGESEKALHNIVKWLYNVAPDVMPNSYWPGLIEISKMVLCNVRKDLVDKGIAIPIILAEGFTTENICHSDSPIKGDFIPYRYDGEWLGLLDEEADAFNVTLIDARTCRPIGKVNSIDLDWVGTK